MSEVALRLGQAFGLRSKSAVKTRTSLPLIARVETYTDARAALADWRDLAGAASAPPYAMPAWLLPWIETVGTETGVAPLIIVARDDNGRALALLPFGLIRQGGLTTAVFLGAKDSNFNMGLFRPDCGWTRAGVLDLLRGAALASGRKIDLFALRNQPHEWNGVTNPFVMLPRQPSPSFAYKARLTPDSDDFFKGHLSRESRKKLRQKMNRLRAFGAVDVLRAETPAEIGQVLDAFVEQRKARSAAQGLPADDIPILRRFLDRATEPGCTGPANGAEPVEFQALRCDGRVVATFGGVRRGERFSGMLTSFTADPDFARASPGELLLAEVIKQFCETGLATFDLGIGEARYKETYCPDVEPLFDSLVPLTLRGHLFARAEGLRLQAKRSIKQSTWAWPLVQRLRKVGSQMRVVSPLRRWLPHAAGH